LKPVVVGLHLVDADEVVVVPIHGHIEHELRMKAALGVERVLIQVVLVELNSLVDDEECKIEGREEGLDLGFVVAGSEILVACHYLHRE
jgi:hypothetical protein